MREILFRGKRIDNGEWVEGFYSRCLQKGENNKPCECHVILEVSDFGGKLYTLFSYFDIDPATVDQYTGLTDKNGKKIWEGDVLLADFSDLCIGKQMAVVVYKEQLHGFAVVPVDDWAFITWWECEIVGNIHDNPELLQN